MKRVVEDVAIIDEQVGQLYEKGQRGVCQQQPQNIKGGHSTRSVFASNLESSLTSNIQGMLLKHVYSKLS